MTNATRANHGFIATIVAVATIGGFMFGYDSGVINGTQEGLEGAFGVSELGTGVLVAALLLGCAAGAFGAGRLADRIGRRGVMMVAAVLFILSALGAGAATTAELFVIARFIGGLGVGAASVTAPVYISEVAPARVRGRLATVQQIMIITGLTGAFVANYVLARTAGGSTAEFWLGFPAWRWMLWLQLVPASIYLAALFSIPESPRYLVMKGRIREAEAVLTRLADAEQAAAKIDEIRDTLPADHQPRLADLRDPATGRIRPILWAGIGLATFQQLVGINIVFYYGSVLWQSVGFSENDALLINILSGSVSILACLGTILLIDRIGRKPLLLTGSAGMAVSLAVMAACFASGTVIAGQLTLPDRIGTVALVAANIYVIFFNASWGPVMWVMLGEMFPNQIRGSALAVSGLAQWLANFAIVLSFPWAASRLGLPVTYGFYAAAALLSLLFVRARITETRGRELEQMRG